MGSEDRALPGAPKPAKAAAALQGVCSAAEVLAASLARTAGEGRAKFKGVGGLGEAGWRGASPWLPAREARARLRRRALSFAGEAEA